MDGIPIGRKINLKAYGGYDELASAVDQLFRGVLAGIDYNKCLFQELFLCVLMSPSL